VTRFLMPSLLVACRWIVKDVLPAVAKPDVFLTEQCQGQAMAAMRLTADCREPGWRTGS
jgi:hypothetical protein